MLTLMFFFLLQTCGIKIVVFAKKVIITSRHHLDNSTSFRILPQ
jgi:hypothetical protein